MSAKIDVDHIDGEAVDRTLPDERRAVIEREEHIDRAGAERQRRHQACDQRTGALGGKRRGHHDAGSDGHFDDEGEREIKVGGHFLFSLSPVAGDEVSHR